VDKIHSWTRPKVQVRGAYSSALGRARRDEARSAPKRWWAKTFEQHPLRTLSAGALSVGGVLLLMFFAHLGELPEIDLASSTSILAAVALIGLLVGVVFGGSMGVAGWLYLNAGPELDWLRTPFNLRLAAIPGLLMVLWIIAQSIFGLDYLPTLNGFFLCSGLCLLIGYARAEHLLAVGELPLKSRDGWPFHEAALAFAAYSLMWKLSLLVGLLCLAAMFPSRTKDFEAVLAIVAWACISAGLSIALAQSNQRGQLRKFLILAATGLIVMVLLTQNYTGLAVASVRAIGLGDVLVKLVLTERGCQIINGAALVPVCQFNKDEKIGVVCPAILKSKIGTPFMVGLAPFSERGAWPAIDAPAPIPIPKAEVLSWPRIQALKAQPIDHARETPEAFKQLARAGQRGGLKDHQTAWLNTQCGTPTPPSIPASDSAESSMGAKGGGTAKAQ